MIIGFKKSGVKAAKRISKEIRSFAENKKGVVLQYAGGWRLNIGSPFSVFSLRVKELSSGVFIRISTTVPLWLKIVFWSFISAWSSLLAGLMSYRLVNNELVFHVLKHEKEMAIYLWGFSCILFLLVGGAMFDLILERQKIKVAAQLESTWGGLWDKSEVFDNSDYLLISPKVLMIAFLLLGLPLTVLGFSFVFASLGWWLGLLVVLEGAPSCFPVLAAQTNYEKQKVQVGGHIVSGVGQLGAVLVVMFSAVLCNVFYVGIPELAKKPSTVEIVSDNRARLAFAPLPIRAVKSESYEMALAAEVPSAVDFYFDFLHEEIGGATSGLTLEKKRGWEGFFLSGCYLLVIISTVGAILILWGFLRDFRGVEKVKELVPRFSTLETVVRGNFSTKGTLSFFRASIVLWFLSYALSNFLGMAVSFSLFSFVLCGEFLFWGKYLAILLWVPAAFYATGAPLWVGKLVLLSLLLPWLFRFGSYIFWVGSFILDFIKEEETKKLPPHIDKTLDEFCKKSGIPKPRVMFVEGGGVKTKIQYGTTLNFALLIGEETLDAMSNAELAAMLAHEVAHIKYDVPIIKRYQLLSWLVGVSPALLALLVDWRVREYHADKFAARLLGTSRPLISALNRLDLLYGESENRDRQSSAVGFVTWIKTAIVKLGRVVVAWYRFTYGQGLVDYTHPTLKDRIAALSVFAK